MKKQDFRQLVKECIKNTLCERESYYDGISRMIRQAKKEKNPEKILYYQQAYDKTAVAGWDQFKGSWAYGQWVKQNAPQIEKVKDWLKQTEFSSVRMREDSQPEPYDAETDTFAPGPRDRLQGEEEDLQIPEFPKAITKQHNMDGQSRWFVYSSPDSQALIIGYGKSLPDAVHNAKTTAKYIKQGGVGHTGELKEGPQTNWDSAPEPKLEWKILQWAKKRFKRERSGELNRGANVDMLQKLIKMLELELNSTPNDNSERGSGPDAYPPIYKTGGKVSDVG